MIRVAVVFPTCNPERAHHAATAWSERGYEVHVLVDGDTKLLDRSVFSHVLHPSVYPGYFQAANQLTLQAVTDGVDNCVVAGDDMFPDQGRMAVELAAEYLARFPSGFGIMQPIGDTGLPCDTICGSPWMGREWITKSYFGAGPYWPGYRQFGGDTELHEVAKRLGILWQRTDVSQHHAHWARRDDGATIPTPYQQQAISKYYQPDVAVFKVRGDAGFPGAWVEPASLPAIAVETPSRRVSNDWPRLFTPAVGCLPPRAEHRADERLLHVALRTPNEKNPGLERDLRGISSEYAEVDWCNVSDSSTAIVEAATALRPTLVFIQAQGKGCLNPEAVPALRAACAPNAVLVQWDGDQHHKPDAPEREWFVRLGAQLDASLICNTEYPTRYAELGVKRPGYLQAGFDDAIYRLSPPTEGTERVVLLAAHYPLHRRRSRMIKQVRELLLPNLGVYGNGWDWLPSPKAHPLLRQSEESGVYAAAHAALSISIVNNLPRYTSDRLLRMLGSGAVVVAERFPDCEGLGLVDGVNCLLWRGWEELQRAVAMALGMSDEARAEMRRAAVEVARLHTWAVRAAELCAVVDAVREDRR